MPVVNRESEVACLPSVARHVLITDVAEEFSYSVFPRMLFRQMARAFGIKLHVVQFVY